MAGVGLSIDGREIGAGRPCYVVAEIGFNHGGDLDLAEDMVAAAAGAGVDAVKFQTYRADRLVLEAMPHFGLIKDGELSLQAHLRLARAAAARGVHFLSTPYGRESVDLLERVGVPAYKIASMDLTNHALLGDVAATGKPVLLSTGMATLGEIAEAVATLKDAGNTDVVLLHCISKYPAPPETANLRTIGQLADEFGLPVGYSDHVLGPVAALGAVALGACVVEKHFTTDKSLPGPDHKISADPAEMGRLVRDIRRLEAALGRRAADSDRPDRAEASQFRRSLFAAVDIPAGTAITDAMVKCVRPGGGLPPKRLGQVIGRVARAHIAREAPISLESL